MTAEEEERRESERWGQGFGTEGRGLTGEGFQWQRNCMEKEAGRVANWQDLRAREVTKYTVRPKNLVRRE